MILKLLQTGLRNLSISSRDCYMKNPYPKKLGSSFIIYSRQVAPSLAQQYPTLLAQEAAAKKWNMLSKEEKAPFRELYLKKIKEHDESEEYLKNHEEFEEIMKEVTTLTYDKPTMYSNINSFYYGETCKLDKSSRLSKTSEIFKSMSEEEKEMYQAKYDKHLEQVKAWKLKVRADGRSTKMNSLKRRLQRKLEVIESDKPKRIAANSQYLKQHYKNFQGKGPVRVQSAMKSWNSLSSEEKQPYLEASAESSQELAAWKEVAKQDGRMKVIVRIRLLITQLKN